MKRVFEFNTYTDYLIVRLGSATANQTRKNLAEFIPVHPTYISQVLKGRSHLSLEQGESVNEFLQHTDDEGEFFLLLIMKDRAGTTKLRLRFSEKIKTFRNARINLKKQLDINSEVSREDQEHYYSTYLYSALHVLASIPAYETAENIAAVLHLPLAKIQEALDFLVHLNILKVKAGSYSDGVRSLHLGHDSPLITRMHTNWRLHMLQNIQHRSQSDLHYSACVSLSSEDVILLKESMMKHLKEYISVISKSKEEEAYVITFDFYSLLK